MDLVTGQAKSKSKVKPPRSKNLKKKPSNVINQKLLKKGKSNNPVPCSTKRIRNYDVRPVGSIPQYQLSMNWYDNINCTQLYWKVKTGNLNEIEFLLASRADPTQQGKPNECLIETAIKNKKQDVIALLLENGCTIPYKYKDELNFKEITENYLKNKQKQLESLLNEKPLTEETIKIQFYYFNSIPNRIKQFNRLTYLQLPYNNLIDIPDIIFELNTLTSLDISHNLLRNLPNEINNLKGLKSLNCSYNYLSEFPLIQDLNQLTDLNLSNNNIIEITKEISSLFRLIKFNISNNYIQIIPKYLIECSGLESLNFSRNSIITVKDFPFHLFNSLNSFDISFNFIRELPYKTIFTSNIPKILKYRGNRFPKEYNRIMFCLYFKRKSLHLSGLGLTYIPDEIGFLTHLTYLDLSFNNLKVLPSKLSNLISLTSLDLSYNQIEILPLYFSRFSKLKELNLKETSNYITNPPRTVIEKGVKGIQRYFEDLLEGEPCYRTKLMLVGQENVGKSTLLHAMKQERKKQKLKRSNISTDGIDIEKWVVKTADKKSLTFSAWDFAGQEIYYATHSFFLSSKAIYLVIWDMRYDTENARVSFWLNSVESRASNAPVILVGTHYDDPMFSNNPEKLSNILNNANIKYSSRYQNIKGIIGVSCTEYDGISQLMELLESTALKMPNILDELPKIYQNLEDLIIEEKDSWNPPAVSWNEFTHTIASRVNFKDEDHLLDATQFLNNLGSLVFFEKSKTSDALIVLDPQWLTSMFASIITTSHNYTQFGILHKNNLSQIWRPPRYPVKMHSILIQLLKDFEIIFELPPDTDNGNNDILYLIPSLLPIEKPSIDILWPKYDSLYINTEFNRTYEIEFVPNGLFSKLMVRFLHFINKPVKYWRNGIIGIRNNSKGFVELNGNLIHFTTRGDSAAEFLRVIDEIVNTLIVDWFKVRICSVTIKCPHCINNRESNPFIFDLADCEQTAAKGNIRNIECLQSKNTPYPIRLDRIVPDIAMADFDGSIIDYKDIKISKTLGKGSFGVIYLGEWNGNVVAVKQLKVEEDMALEAYAEFRKEVWLMSGLDHPCIVNLLGYSTTPLVMVMECVTGGDLYAFIHNDKINIDWHVRLKIALDMAYGMQFLHSINPPLLHRDLKSPNVLVMKYEDGAKVIAKVADFGLSSRLFVDSLQNRAVENPTWCAPEVMVRKEYSEKADVYPYGIMLWELLTREHPYDNYRFQFQVEDDVLRGVRPEIPNNCWPEYASLMSECWDPEPDNRPIFDDIIPRLLRMVKSEIGLNNFRYAIDPCINKVNNEQPVINTPRKTTVQDDKNKPIQLQGDLLKEFTVDVKLNCLIGDDNQVWCGTEEGYILIFSAISGLFMEQYIWPVGSIDTLIQNNDKIWSGGKDGIGIWQINNNLKTESTFTKIIKKGNIIVNLSSSTKRRFKKGNLKYIILSIDGTLSICSSENNISNPIDILKLKNGIIDYKSRVKGRFFLEADSKLLSLQCSSENELNEWVTDLTYIITKHTSYPSNLTMLKKLPVAGNISSLSIAVNSITLVGVSNSKEIRTVDSMLRSKKPISFPSNISGKLLVNHIVSSNIGIWAAVNNQILKFQPRTFAFQLMFQEKHVSTITHFCINGKELWSCSRKEICCYDIRNGRLNNYITADTEINCLLSIGKAIWAGGSPSIYIYDTKSKKLQKTLQKHKNPVRGMSLVKNSNVWSYSKNGEICIWK